MDNIKTMIGANICRKVKSKPGERVYIFGVDGNKTRSGKNLRVLRDYASKHIIKQIELIKNLDGGGTSIVVFDRDEICATDWACFDVMRDKLTTWLMFKGAPTTIHDKIN